MLLISFGTVYCEASASCSIVILGRSNDFDITEDSLTVLLISGDKAKSLFSLRILTSSSLTSTNLSNSGVDKMLKDSSKTLMVDMVKVMQY